MPHHKRTALWICPQDGAASQDAANHPHANFALASIERDERGADAVALGDSRHPALPRFSPKTTIVSAAPRDPNDKRTAKPRLNIEIWDDPDSALAIQSRTPEFPVHCLIYLRQPSGAEICGGYKLAGASEYDAGGYAYRRLIYEDAGPEPAKWIISPTQRARKKDGIERS